MFLNFFLFQDPKVYVQTILDVHKKYHALVLTAFANDAGFVAALDKVCQSIIDAHHHTKTSPTYYFGQRATTLTRFVP